MNQLKFLMAMLLCGTGLAGLNAQVNLNVGALPPGKSITVTYLAAVDNPFPTGLNTLTAQGHVSGTNFSSRLTDDPATGAPDDATVTMVAPLVVVCMDTVYVNDNSLVGDVYTSAIGNDANTGGPSDPFATIQKAIDEVCDSGYIYVDVGTYSETVTVNKALSIYGPQKDVDPRTAAALRTAGSASEAIVDGGGGSSPIFNITFSGVELNGLEIRNGSGDLIVSPDAAPVKTGVFVKYCLVNTSSGDEGIQLRNLDGGGVEYCLVSSIAGDGINLSSGCTNSYVKNNEITGSASTNGFIYLYDNGPSMLVDNNLLTGNTGENGIMIGNKSGSNSNSNSAFANNAIVSNNTVTGHAGSEVGVYINTSRVNVTDNSITGWESAGNAALYLRYNIKDIVVTDNTITGNVKGIKVSSGVSAGNAPLISINQNDLSANTDGMSNSSTGVVDAQLNWWGNADGPSGSGPGTGTSVSANVDFCPWLDAAPPAGMPTSTTGAVTNTNTGLFYCSIQAAIDAASTWDSIYAFAGTYTEDVLVNKSITLAGAGMGQSTIEGPKGGNNATVRIAAANVKVDGFTITRDGNSAAEWNDGTLNSAGIAIQHQTANAEISNNEIIGNRTGIDVNNSNSNNIHNNRIHRNHTGMIFRNQTDSTNLMENSIVENRTAGVLFLDASGGSNAPLQQALNSTFNNNDISGNWYGQIVDRQSGGSLPTPGTTNIKNFECNWYGSTMPEVSTNNSNEPGYAVLIPTYYGGTATDTSSNADILGPGSANFDYIFFLTNGTDNSGDNGFQPVPNSCNGCPGGGLVTNINTGNMYCSIQEAIDDAATTPGDTITIAAGTYLEDVLVNKADLTILGAGIDQTTIDHTGQSGQGNAGVHILANGVTMKDLTVTGNQAASVPRYGLKVGTSSVTTDDVTLDSVKVTQSFRTGFDLARPKDITLKNVFAIDNGGAGIFMTNTEGAVIQDVTTSGNPWTGVSISTRNDWGGDASGIFFTGNNIFEEDTSDNGGIQLEMVPGKTISWSTDSADGKDVTLQMADASYVLSGPTSNAPYDPYFRFFSTLANAQNASGGTPDHIDPPNRYIRDADNSDGLTVTNFYVFDNDSMTIQAAIDASIAGNTINVYAGTFGEDVLVNKADLTILGAGIDQTIIDHSGQGGQGNAGVHILANGVTMKGFTVIDNDGGNTPRYGLKVGTSSVTTDDVTLDSVKVSMSYRTGFDLARPKDITLKNVFAIDNGGAGIFMSNVEGAIIQDITTSGNPWTGVSVATRHDWGGDSYGVVFTGTNSFGENTGKNGGLQLESDTSKIISWGSDVADGKDVTIQQGELDYVMSGPTTNVATNGGDPIYYAPYFRFYQTLPQAQSAAGIGPDHVDRPRYIQDAFCSSTPDSTNFYVYDFVDTAMTIQAAVDAAVDGNTVNVFAGEFIEQVEITKDLILVGQGKGVTTVKGFANMPLFFTTSGPNYPVIYVHNTNSVIVKDLTVDGDGQGNTNHRYQGIAYDDAGGKITNVEVKALRHTPLNGAQGGIGIFVNATNGTGRGVWVTQCMVYDFQKTGMSFSGADLIATADSNMVTGSGSLGSGLPAQNGIQFYGTNGGNISNNQISAINYTPSSYVASGIITLYDLSTVNIFGNVLDSVEMGIYGLDNPIMVYNNEATGGEYGLYTYADSGATASLNAMNNSFDSYDYAVLVGNDQGTVTSSVQNNSFTNIEGFALYAFGTVDSVQGQCNWYGSINPNDVENLVAGQVVYEPYLLDGTDSLPDVGFQPNPGACQSADCPDGSCEGCFAFEPFNDSSAVGGWITDRYEPDSFYVDETDSILVHLINASDAQTGFQSTQGKKYELDYTGAGLLTIDLYVPSSWETTGRRMAGLWGVAYNDAGDTISGYPIIEYASDNGDPRFQVYDNGIFKPLPLPCDFAYDAWHTLRMELLSSGEFLFSMDNEHLTSTNFGSASNSIREVILQGHNTAAGVTYDINWDNLAYGNAPEVLYDATLPEPIAVGSGISNEHMAVGEYCGIDAGLKAIRRFKGDIVPVDSNVYQVGTGVSPTNAADTAGDPGTARWNYVMSVNLGDYTFNDLNVYLDIDFDNSDSACGVGPYEANISQFMIANSMAGQSVYQDAQNLGFGFWQGIGDPAILPFDPYAEGTYDLRIRIENKDGLELLNVPISVEVDCDYLDPEDNLEPPILACPSDTTIYLTASADPWSTGMATTSGSCAQNVTYSDSTAVDSCGESGVIIRTWSLAYGDSTQTCSQTITILDTTAPVLSACPSDTALFATSDSGATVDFVAPTAEEAVYFEGFENPAFQSGSGSYQGWNDFNSPLVRVTSGTGGITSSSGSAHGLIDTNGSAGQTGVFGRLGGYRSSFGNGFSTSLDVYIDLADPAVAGDTYGWDLTTAASTQSGGHLRDFIFHAASNASGNVLIAGSNNTNFTRRNDLASLNNYEITTSGWYTFEWVFRDSAGSLAVDLNLSDAAGNHLLTETRYNAADNIATTVGGNRYMWFTFLETESLAIDNTSMVRDAAVSCSATSGSTFAVGTTTVTCSSTDSCGNMSSCSFDVMVLDTAGALNYDGANDVVVVPHDASLTNFGTALTVEAWIKPETVSGNHGVVGKWNDLGSNNRRSYLLWARDDDAQFYISSNGSDFPNALASNVLTTGEWTHLAGTYDGSTVKLYVNGVLTASTSFSGSIANNTADPLLVGAVDGGGSSRRFFDGDLDEVRIYGRALCQSEIQAHMNCELDSGTTGLAAYYDFNQGYAQVDNTGLDSLIDRSGNGNDGTLQNFALMGSSSNWTFQADSVNGSCAPYDDPGIAVYGNNQLISDGDVSASAADGTDFGTQLTGSSTTNTFYIVNTGTEALVITDTVITGADAAQFAVASLSNDNIAPGDSAVLGITYSPTTAAIHNATVQVSTNACNASTFDFAIQGNADQLMCDTIRFVTNSSWRMSTVVTPSSYSGGWSGVMGNLPDSSTYTQPVMLGQPYSFQTIFPVDSSQVIKAGNNITYYRKTFVMDTLAGIGTKILSTMDDQMELYVNGQLVVGQYVSNYQNGRLPGYGAQFFGDTTVDNGFNGTKTYGYTNPNSLDDVFKPGTNEVIYVLRNLSKASDAGGFSFSMQVDGCEGDIAPDTTITPPQDSLCDTVFVQSSADWMESTTVTASNFSGGWSGVMGTLPDTSTFTQNVMLGQPYSFQTIFPVDSSNVIKAGNNIRYYHTTITLDSLVDISAKILSTMDDQMEVYVNGQLLVGQYVANSQNGRLPGYGARFNSDTTVDNGFDATKTYGYTAPDAMGSIFKPGVNDVIYVLRNRANASEAGGFSVSLEVAGCSGDVPADTTTPPQQDTVADFIVSNNGWEQSTVVEPSNFSGDWSGASALPLSSTYTLPAEEGQPYGFMSIENVDSAKVIKSGNSIHFFRRRFVITDSLGLDARFRMTGDDGFEIYLNGTLVARENNSGSANYVAPVHDLQYNGGVFTSNGAGGSQAFDVVANLNLDTVFTTDTNEVVVALRNKGKASDLGGFSFRLDLEKGGSPVIVKSGAANPKVEIAGDLSGLDFVLYPNPTTGMVNIKLTQEVSTTDNEIMLQDASGRIISRGSFQSFAEEGGLKLDMSHYPAGIYLIRLKAGDQYISKRLIKN